MKIKDLLPDTNMGGVKVKTPDGHIGYWTSQWAKGVWLSGNADGNGKMHPIFVKQVVDAREWDIAEDHEETNLK